MAQPLLHDSHINTGETQMGGRGVAPHLNGTHLLAFDARRLAGGFGQVSAAEAEKTGIAANGSKST
jgi:hypothetical protein